MAAGQDVLRVLTAAAVLMAAPAFAQEVVIPPVEIGVTGSGIVPVSREGGAGVIAAGGASFVYNVARRRIGIEATGELVGPTDSSGLYGIYQVQGRFPVSTNRDAAWATFEPHEKLSEISFAPGQYRPPLDVRYVYFNCFGANRGVLEIDRIALVR